MNRRHDARDETGRFRSRTEDEGHAAHLAELVANRSRAKYGALLDRIHPGPPAYNPLTGFTPTLSGGAIGSEPFARPGAVRTRAQDDARESFLDGLFPGRASGRQFTPYSLSQ